MSGLNDILEQLMQPGTLETVSERTGVPPSAAGSVVASALPLLVGALARNAQTQEGAASLATAPKGIGLDQLAGRLQTERTELERASPMGSLLTNFLDQDGDGSAMDDVAGLAKRFLK